MLYIREHFSTITRHRHEVIRLCKKCGILWQGMRHDLSKYSPTEFLEGIRYYQGDRSPNVGAREANGYSKAWMHHQGRNRHHFEYWVDYNSVTKQKEPVQMPVRYVVEMFCDRVAASKIYFDTEYDDGKALYYYRKGRSRLRMHRVTAAQIEKLLVMLESDGEDRTCAYIRHVVKPWAKREGVW